MEGSNNGSNMGSRKGQIWGGVPKYDHFGTLLGPIIGGVFSGTVILHGLSLCFLHMCIYIGGREGVKKGSYLGYLGPCLGPFWDPLFEGI